MIPFLVIWMVRHRLPEITGRDLIVGYAIGIPVGLLLGGIVMVILHLAFGVPIRL